MLMPEYVTIHRDILERFVNEVASYLEDTPETLFLDRKESIRKNITLIDKDIDAYDEHCGNKMLKGKNHKYIGFLFKEEQATTKFVCAVENRDVDTILDLLRKPIKEELNQDTKNVYKLYINP